MKICAVCDKIQRNPQHCIEIDVSQSFVVCEEHKTATLKECFQNVMPKLTFGSVTNLDYIWQGPGHT